MISSMPSSLLRVLFFWYALGILWFSLGDPSHAEAAYAQLNWIFPWVPELELDGLHSAFKVQLTLLWYWSALMVGVWCVSLITGGTLSFVKVALLERRKAQGIKPHGEFRGVSLHAYTQGALAMPVVPGLQGPKVSLSAKSARRGDTVVSLDDSALRDVVAAFTPAERQLCEELFQLLVADPEHYAGLGHGVGLLEHTLNVVEAAAKSCTPDFRLPLLAALSHDIGKLVTFRKNEKGEWERVGLHSRESTRILATLPGFCALPELHQDALLLAVAFDHAPSKMPQLRGEPASAELAMRIILALSQADQTATAAEKDRHLEKLQPEDLLWRDFVENLRNAPVLTRNKKGGVNMLNIPANNPYLFLYEAAWRDAAIERINETTPELAAALDLNRRDRGKLAKYTKYLADLLRTKGLLVEQHEELSVTQNNPLWDIQSGKGEKSMVFRGCLVLRKDPLWETLNYRFTQTSPFEVTLVGPNSNPDGGRRPADKEAISEIDVTVPIAVKDVSALTISNPRGVPSAKPKAVPAVPAPPRDKVEEGASAPAPAPAAAATASRTPVEAASNAFLSIFGGRKVVAPAQGTANSPAAHADKAAAIPSAASVPTAAVEQPALGPGVEAAAKAETVPEQAHARDALVSSPEKQASPPIPAASKAPTPEVPATVPDDPVFQGAMPMPAAPAAKVAPRAQAGQEGGAVASKQTPPGSSRPGQPAANVRAARPVAEPSAPKPSVPNLFAPKGASKGFFGDPQKGRQPAAAQPSANQAPGTKVKEASAAPAPAQPPSKPVAATEPIPVRLSQAEKRAGVAVADQVAVQQYPHLAIGEKYFPETAPDVVRGSIKAGQRFQS